MSGWRRVLLVLVLVMGLVIDGALWSGAFARGDFEASMLLLYPERTVGREMVLSLVDVTAVEADRYRIAEGQWSGVVLGDPSGLSVGDELYLGGRFVDVGVIEEHWRELAPQRGGKKMLGLLAMALVGLTLLAGTRLRPEGAELRG